MRGRLVVNRFFRLDRSGRFVAGGFDGRFDGGEVRQAGHVVDLHQFGTRIDGGRQHARGAVEGFFNEAHARGAMEAGREAHAHVGRADVIARFFDGADEIADAALGRVEGHVGFVQGEIDVDIAHAGDVLQAAFDRDHTGTASHPGNGQIHLQRAG